MFIKKKRKLSYKGLFLTLSVSFLVCALAVPATISFLMVPKDKISYSIKETVALAGKNYFDEEVEKDYVLLSELIKKGYVTETSELAKNNCNNHLSSVSIKKVNNKYKYIVDLYCNSYFSNLTLYI